MKKENMYYDHKCCLNFLDLNYVIIDFLILFKFLHNPARDGRVQNLYNFTISSSLYHVVEIKK
jgi:hypothetical protein